MTDGVVARTPAPQRARDDDRRDRAPRLTVTPPLLAAGGLAAAATLLVTFLPSLSFAYRSQAAHASIETAATIGAAVAATLVAGRAMRSASRNEALLAVALGCLALTNLVFSVLPALFGWSAQFSAWGGLVGRLAGALLFAAAALLPERRLPSAGRTLARAGALTLGGLAVLGLLVALEGASLPDPLDPALSPESANRVQLVGHPVVLTVQALLIVIYSAATAGFAVRARRRGDRLLRGLAIACLLAAFARVNYFLFPSVYSEWVYTGDLLRLAQYLVILAVVSMELLEYQRRASVAAVLDERRRVARELHDGLAQELAFIRGAANRIRQGTGVDESRVRELVSATERALDEARSAIATLSRPIDESLSDALRYSAEAIAGRTGTRVTVTGDEPPSVDVDRRHALQRIVREATTNATKHGKARDILIRMSWDAALCVTIVDDGSGFDTGAGVRVDSYGLASMRDRAEALGGTLTVSSVPGEGTTVDVRLP